MSTVANPATLAYKVADMKLADWGRKEISIAEAEMPLRRGCDLLQRV